MCFSQSISNFFFEIVYISKNDEKNIIAIILIYIRYKFVIVKKIKSQ